MLRRFRRPAAPDRAREWKAFAERLELRRAAGTETMLRDLLDLPSEAEPTPVYRLERAPGAALYLFDHLETRRGPAGTARRLVTVALLAADHGVAPVPLRAVRKLPRVLESLGATRVGGVPVRLPHAPGFHERVTLYARRVEDAAALVTPPVREVLERALCARAAEPELTVSERHLVLRCRGAEAGPGAEPAPGVAFDELELLAADLLSLYAALAARERDERGLGEG